MTNVESMTKFKNQNILNFEIWILDLIRHSSFEIRH